ncbi:hypothetical protein BDW72DRAFT_199493 [Aspergillus terricola var. indicus]
MFTSSSSRLSSRNLPSTFFLSLTRDTESQFGIMESDNASEYSETEQHTCEKCGESDKLRLFRCSICDPSVFLCETDWENWDPHKSQSEAKRKSKLKSKSKSGEAAKHERIPFLEHAEMEEEYKRWHEDDGEAQLEQHKNNQPSFWFGADFINGSFRINSDLYGDIILSSAFQDREKQFPSLVSFIGNTGAGKSTLIKTIINYGKPGSIREANTIGWARILTPIPGIKAFSTRPTSSDVHLYHDTATIDTARPILFADSEGLLGGNQTPFASSIESIAGIARKIISWKESTHEITRKYCVEHIYPRILYAFSEVLCYVIQQNPRVVESLVSQMIMWADKAHNASLNQVTLPRVILVLNNVTLGEEERKIWEDGMSATQIVVENLKNCTNLSGELQGIANRWNSILDVDDQIHSVMGFYRQVQRLREKILGLSKEVGVERLNTFNQLNSRWLESFLNIGMEHFFTKFDEPFDFFQITRINKPRSKSIVANATYLMTKMEETEPNQKELDKRCHDLFVSYWVIMALCERMSGSSIMGLLEGTTVSPHFQSAHKEFHTSARCWFTRNRRRCRNTREGHTRGHLDHHGELIASGEYETDYKEQDSVGFMESIKNDFKEWVLFLREPSPENDESIVEQHLKMLKREREFWKQTFSNTICFCCLVEPPDFSLECGHTICCSCVKIFGHKLPQDPVYTLDFCPLCSEGNQTQQPFAQIQLKPEKAGVRVLAIDGGGVRGVISARILQMLEEQIGLDLPLFHFFDVIIGTSSGGIISLALGANLWSAQRCIEAFKRLSKDSFEPLLFTKIPVLGYLVSMGWGSYYGASAIEETLRNTFSPTNTKHRFLFSEPYKGARDGSETTMRDLKVGVTAVNVIDNHTTLMTNYNRKLQNEGKEDDVDEEIKVWEAARCTSAAPFLFPVYRASNGHAFQDGGMNHNNPVGLAVKEAPSLWTGRPNVDIVLSIGTGSADGRIAGKNIVTQYAVHGWLKRCIDSFESKLDAERLWQEYYATLDEDGRRRHHRLNIKLSGTLPFMGDTRAMDKMGDETRRFFHGLDAQLQLRSTAEALLASLFYICVNSPTKPPLHNDTVFAFRAQILCRLEQRYQCALLDRLQSSGCSFLVHGRVVSINFAAHRCKFERGESFRQDIQWQGALSDMFHICLVFRGKASTEEQPELDASPTTTAGSTTTPAVKYEVSGSPYNWARI